MLIQGSMLIISNDYLLGAYYIKSFDHARATVTGRPACAQSKQP